MDMDFNPSGMNIYVGIIEDNKDPLEIGRVRVRVFGLHSLSQSDIPTESLPWVPCMLPVTSASYGGAGQTPNLSIGSRVIVMFFSNDSLQEPLVLGSLNFIHPNAPVRVNGTNVSLASDSNVNQSSLPSEARSGAVETPKAQLSVNNGNSEWQAPEDLQQFSRYPHNEVRRSRSGIVEEWDDTPGNERIALAHPSGSFQQYRPDGSFEQTIYGNNYTIKAQDDNVYIEGNCNIHIHSDCNTHVSGDYNVTVGGDYNLKVQGNINTSTNGGKYDTVKEDMQQLVLGDYNRDVGGDNSVNVGGESTTIIGSNNYSLTKGETVVVTHGGVTESIKGNHLLKAKGEISIGSESTLKLNSNSDLGITSSGKTTVGSTGAINIASGGKVDINSNGPSVTKEEIEIEDIELPDFDAPDFEYSEPAIIAIEPDMDVRKSVDGPITSAEYQNYISSSYYEPKKSYSNNDSYPSTSTPTTQLGTLSGFDALLAFIGKGEGSYDAANNGTNGGSIVGSTNNFTYNGKKLSQLTIGEIMELQKGTRDTGRTVFAVGRFQIIPSTLKNIAFPNSGLKLTDVFNKENQDVLGITLLINGQRKGLANYLKGGDTPIRTAHLQFAQEWASIPDPFTGNSYYGAGNKSAHSIGEVQKALVNARKDYLAEQNVPDNSTTSRVV